MVCVLLRPGARDCDMRKNCSLQSRSQEAPIVFRVFDVLALKTHSIAPGEGTVGDASVYVLRVGLAFPGWPAKPTQPHIRHCFNRLLIRSL